MLKEDLLRVNNIPLKLAKKLLTTSKKDVQKAIDYSFDTYNLTADQQSSNSSITNSNVTPIPDHSNFTADETEKFGIEFDQIFELEQENSLLIPPIHWCAATMACWTSASRVPMPKSSRPPHPAPTW